MKSWPDKSGFMAFEFVDGQRWISQEPAISFVKPLSKAEAKYGEDVPGPPPKKKKKLNERSR